MRGALAAGLERTAAVLRETAAVGALLLGVRFLWLSVESGISHSQSVTKTPHSSGAYKTIPPGPEPAGLSWNTQRPDLEQLRALAGENLAHEEPQPGPPAPILRRILVDLGPARSEVFLGKKLVGQTPYGGQIACARGDEIRVLVLPPQGVPIERRVVCRGDTLLVRE